MKKIVILVSISLAGCGSTSDNIGYRAGRTVLAVGTLGISEVPLRENDRQGLAKKTCLEAGIIENTPEYTKCFLDIKKAQFSGVAITNSTTVNNH